MKTAFVTAALAIIGSAAAAPAPTQKLQKQIQTLEVQILDVVNDIVQSSSELKSDYSVGISQFNALANKLDGPMPCAPFTPGQPSTKKQAIKALQTSQEGLMQLSLDLQNPANSIENGDLHADVCTALGYYAAIANFVGA